MINKIDKKIELMAPAGTYETLMAAIQGGADSVYFGAGNLNMRSKSSANFQPADLKKIADICKNHGVKSYLTLNTVIYDKDYEQVDIMLNTAKEAGISAVIASDISVIQAARDLDVNVHASTQLNISNKQAVKFFSQFCDVMVLARELSLDQVKEISNYIESNNICGPNGDLIRIEVFVHGALCMAVSGKCYLSLHLHDSSANRGACLQPCRRKYEVTEKEKNYQLEIDNEYIMSPKDLCTIGFLDKVLDAGVEVLKIEGRGRPADYVKRVCSVYKEAINAWKNNTYSPDIVQIWESKLAEVYNRGFWDGYYLGRTFGEWNDIHGSKATKKKHYIGVVTNYYQKIKVAEILLQSDDLNIDDDIIIIGSTSGVVESKVSEIRNDNELTATGKKGETISIPMNELVRRNDKVFRIIEA